MACRLGAGAQPALPLGGPVPFFPQGSGNTILPPPPGTSGDPDPAIVENPRS
ncbi:hypothetical protein ACFQ0B_54475 [Nonomuraea thailandensis]